MAWVTTNSGQIGYVDHDDIQTDSNGDAIVGRSHIVGFDQGGRPQACAWIAWPAPQTYDILERFRHRLLGILGN